MLVTHLNVMYYSNQNTSTQRMCTYVPHALRNIQTHNNSIHVAANRSVSVPVSVSVSNYVSVSVSVSTYVSVSVPVSVSPVLDCKW